MKVTEPIIKLCLAELAKQAAAKQRYKDYYDGKCKSRRLSTACTTF